LASVLHEMCHVAQGRAAVAHGSKFLAQVESLLKQGAPISVSNPELGARSAIMEEMVPQRFRLVRARIREAQAREQRAIERRIKQIEAESGEPMNTVTWRDTLVEIETNFNDAASIYGLTWRQALLQIGGEYALLDADAKPLARLRKHVPAWRKAWQKGRRFWLDNEKAKKHLQSVIQAQAASAVR